MNDQYDEGVPIVDLWGAHERSPSDVNKESVYIYSIYFCQS